MTTLLSRLTILAFCLFCAGPITATTSGATTTFNRSTIIGVDQAQRTITFRTTDGQTWTLPVANPNLLSVQHVAKGDQVSIEIDLNDQITKIITLSRQRDSETTQPPGDLKP